GVTPRCRSAQAATHDHWWHDDDRPRHNIRKVFMGPRLGGDDPALTPSHKRRIPRGHRWAGRHRVFGWRPSSADHARPNQADHTRHNQEGFFVLSRRAARNLVCAPVAAVLLAASASGDVQVQGKLEARYTASLAGSPIGKGVWVVDVSDDQYTAAANGRTTGILQVFSGGHGSVAGRGTVNGKPLSSDYASTVVVDKKIDTIHIAVNGGNVKDFSPEPQWLPTPDRGPGPGPHPPGLPHPLSP